MIHLTLAIIRIDWVYPGLVVKKTLSWIESEMIQKTLQYGSGSGYLIIEVGHVEGPNSWFE